MTCVTRLDEKGFRRFTIFDIMKRKRMYRSPLTFCLIMLICSLICFLMHDIDGAVMLGVVLLVVGLGVPLVYFSTFFLSLAKQTKLQQLDPPREVYTVGLTSSQDGISASNATESTTLSWKQVHHVYMTRDAFYLYYTPYKAFILPFDCFDTDSAKVWDLVVRMAGSDKTSVV